MKKKSRKRELVKTVKLPSNNIEMEQFALKHREELLDIIVDNIEFAINNNLNVVEPFSFEGGPYVILINRPAFKENLNHIFKESLKNEQFERCNRIQNLLKTIPKPKFSKNLKNINLLPYGKKSSDK